MRDLKAEIGSDFDRFASEFYDNLRATTPIRSGQARNSWVRTNNNPMTTQSTVLIMRNTVDYADRLDNGWSRQAPNGIVEPAFQRTRRK